MADLQALKAEWYAKLKAEGFTDIEDEFGNLKPEGRPEKTSNKVRMREQAQAYYDQVDSFLLTGEFESEQDRAMWGLLSEGLSIRKIAAAMDWGRDKVHRKVVKYELKAGLRAWKKS